MNLQIAQAALESMNAAQPRSKRIRDLGQLSKVESNAGLDSLKAGLRVPPPFWSHDFHLHNLPDLSD